MKGYNKLLCILILLGHARTSVGMGTWKQLRQNPYFPICKLLGLQIGAQTACLLSKDARISNALFMGSLIPAGLTMYYSLNWGSATGLFNNAARGDTKRALIMLALGADVNAQDTVGNTALIYAVKNNHLPMVRLLVSRGAKINTTNTPGYSALFYALDKIPIARYLLQHGADPNIELPEIQNRQRMRLLHAAVGAGNADIIALLIDFGANMNVQDSAGATPLMYAADLDNGAIVTYLLEHGADLNLKENQGYTAEYIARALNKLNALRAIVEFLEKRNIETVQALKKVQEKTPPGIAHLVGAYLGKPQENVNISLAKAAIAGDVGKINALLAQGADVNAIIEGRKISDNAVLHQFDGASLEWAVTHGQVEAAQALLKKSSKEHQEGALKAAIVTGQPDMVALFLQAEPFADTQGWPALIGAVKRNQDNAYYRADTVQSDLTKTLQFLLQAGADSNLTDASGRTARQIAQANNDQEALKVFGEFDARNNELFAAIKANNVKQVAALLEQGARIDARDIEGNTPLIVAAEKGALDIINLLIQRAEANEKRRPDTHAKEKLLNAQNTYGTTALIWAALNNKPYVVRKLLYAGADKSLTDNQGRDVYFYARWHVPVLLMLQEFENA